MNSRFGTLVAAMHTVTVALLGTCAMTGSLRWRRGHVMRYAVVTAVLTVAVIGGTACAVRQRPRPALHEGPGAVGHAPAARAPSSASSIGQRHRRQRRADGVGQLEAIRSRGSLRVGFLPDALPFAFFNSRTELVGFDIELAHRLAGELGVAAGVWCRWTSERLDDGARPGLLRHRDVRRGGDHRSRQPHDAVQPPTSTKHWPSSSRTRRASGSRPGTASERWARSRLAVPNVPYYIEKLRLRAPAGRRCVR